MFGKKKKQAAQPEPQALRRRPEYGEDRLTQYRLYPKLEEAYLLPILDRHLETLLSGEVDDGNGDLLDGIILAAAREAAPDLVRQRHDHTEALRRLNARRSSDREDFARILEQRRQELAALEAAHANTCRRIAGKESTP